MTLTGIAAILKPQESPGHAMSAMDVGFLFSQGDEMADTPEREEIARRHGFQSYAELLDISDPLPRMPKDDPMQSYVARHPDGYWFVWEEPVNGDAKENA